MTASVTETELFKKELQHNETGDAKLIVHNVRCAQRLYTLQCSLHMVMKHVGQHRLAHLSLKVLRPRIKSCNFTVRSAADRFANE